MKKKITKNQVLGFGLAIATPFIIAACDNNPKGGGTDNSCKCPNGTEHDSKPCCEGTGCNCTEKPKLKQKEYPISLRDGKVIITVKYMALPNATAPDYLEYIRMRFDAFAASNNAGYIDALTNLAVGDGKYTLEVEYAEDVEIYTGLKSAEPGSKTIKVHNDWIIDAQDTDLGMVMIRDSFRTLVANVMMNNMIRMADRYDSSQHIVSGIKSV